MRDEPARGPAKRPSGPDWQARSLRASRASRPPQFRWQRATHDISFDSHNLTYTYAHRGFRTTSKTALDRLMDNFVVDTPTDSHAQPYNRRFRYALALAAGIHFSEIPRYVPYLAPALLAYSLIMLYRGFPYAWRCKQTRVLTSYSEQIVAIPHLPKLEIHGFSILLVLGPEI